uniref:Uncharacterized protein n=1 Tax=Ralstonia solanacearum TaxID=305 RepID=A0A0S4WFZ0_RALSL|nr:protein of unknown function [Ralstonia solanacearum]
MVPQREASREARAKIRAQAAAAQVLATRARGLPRSFIHAP